MASIWGCLLASLRALTWGLKFNSFMAFSTLFFVASDTFSDPFKTLETVDIATSAFLATS